jgi:ribokinase
VGAGDAFTGALAACLAEGAPAEDALAVACAAGGLTCTRRGAIEALPTRDEVLALMDRHGRRPRRWPGGEAR